MHNVGYIRYTVVALALGLAFAPQGFAAGISEARAAKAAFQAEVQAAVDAQSQNDTTSAAQHQSKAQEYLVEARNDYEAGGASKSNDPGLLREYAEVLLRVGDGDLAAEALQRAVDKTPGDATAWFELGRALATLGHPRADDAIRALHRALKIDAKSAAAATTYALLGRVYRQEGIYDLATESFAKALGLDPNNVAAKLGVIAQQVQDGKMKEASDALDALNSVPQEYAMQVPGLLNDAIAQFTRNRGWFPDTAENHIAYAKILLRAGRVAECLPPAERSAVLAPDNYTTWNLIGDLNRQANNTTRAREAYKKSLELKPDQPRTQEALSALDAPAATGANPK